MCLKIYELAGLTPAILATWEAEMGRIEVPGQLGPKKKKKIVWLKLLITLSHASPSHDEKYIIFPGGYLTVSHHLCKIHSDLITLFAYSKVLRHLDLFLCFIYPPAPLSYSFN
jgi:hypothetical protein